MNNTRETINANSFLFTPPKLILISPKKEYTPEKEIDIFSQNNQFFPQDPVSFQNKLKPNNSNKYIIKF
jgi:hypothetical protein